MDPAAEARRGMGAIVLGTVRPQLALPHRILEMIRTCRLQW